MIPVYWGDKSTKKILFPVELSIEALDRVGLLRDITKVIADAGINISDISQETVQTSGRTKLNLKISLRSFDQLSTLIDKISKVPYVINVYRKTQ